MSIAYNEIGNPLTYGDDISYLWDGRELIRHQDEESEITVHMGYNADGLRTLKTVIDFSSLPWTMDYYSYTWSADGTLLGYSVKTYTNESIADVWIIYGENGDAVGFTVKDYEGVEPETYTYYYIKNAQGDVLRVVDETGATMADYTYDAWGNFTYTADANAGANADIIEKYNPVTYRGYYYDTDLEMYYLQSRYYNPQWGRFLNADEPSILGLIGGHVLGANTFAYCYNNPVTSSDPSGYFSIRIINLQGIYVGKSACINAIVNLIFATSLVTYSLFNVGKELILTGMAGEIASFSLSSAITVPMIIAGFLSCTGSVMYAVYMVTTIIQAISYFRIYNRFKIEKAWARSLFTYVVTKA